MRAHTITTQARVRGRLRMKHSIVSVSAVALGAALIAAGASADFSSVHDPRGDPRCLRDGGNLHKPCSHSGERNADIIRATAGHEGGRLKHTVRVVGKIESVGLSFHTDSDPRCGRSFTAVRGRGKEVKFWECDKVWEPGTSGARVDFHRHSVEIFFRESLIGNPDGYRWNVWATAAVTAGPRIDHLNHFVRHELG